MRQGLAPALRLNIVIALLTALSACSDTPAAPSQPPLSAPLGSFTIRGSVRESLLEGTGAPIEGVKVQVLYKNEQGGSALTDAEGSYRIEGVVSADFQLEAIKDGYESSTRAVKPLVSDATLDMALVPIPRTLVGIVTETPPTETTPIIGATVSILAGTNKGKSTTTDAAGFYSLPNVWGTFDVAVVANGYESKTFRATAGNTVVRENATLMPNALTVRSTFSGSVCASNVPPGADLCEAQDPIQVRHWFSTHRAGTVRVYAQFVARGDYYREYFQFEMRCRDAVLWRSQLAGAHDEIRSGPNTVAVPEPCMIEVKAFNYISAFKSGNTRPAPYQIEIDHLR
jgi:hypothetical protein